MEVVRISFCGFVILAVVLQGLRASTGKTTTHDNPMFLLCGLKKKKKCKRDPKPLLISVITAVFLRSFRDGWRLSSEEVRAT